MNTLLKYLGALRVWEVAGKLGFVLIGAMFAMKQLNVANILTLSKIALYCFVNGLAIFSYNAWTGYETDKVNGRLASLHQLSKQNLGFLSLLLFGVSLCIILAHKTSIVLSALGVLLLWVIYSLPKGLKEVPFGGIAVAFLTEIFLFHLSFLFFAEYSTTSIAISIYYGLLVAGGHALHELIDYEADKLSNHRTTAVALGQKSSIMMVSSFFLMAFLWLTFLYFNGKIDAILYIVYGCVNLVVFVLSFRFLRQGRYALFRKLYLFAFSIATIVWVLIKFLCATN